MAVFSPPATAADPGAIEASANEIRAIGNAITGHGQDTTSAMTTAAVSFSDLVSGPIQSVAQKNQAAWQAAILAVGWGADTTQRWATNVAAFKTEIARLQAEWDSAAAAHFGVKSPDLTQVGADATAANKDPAAAKAQATQQYGSAVSAAQNALADRLNAAALSAYDRLKQEASARSGELGRDPSEADLRGLAKAGLLSWGTWVAAGSPSAYQPHITEADGRRLATLAEIAAFTGDSAKLKEILTLVNDVAHGIKNGTGSPDGLKFLDGFYGALGLSGLTYLRNYINKSPDFVDTRGSNAKGFYKGALGDGLLVLSNEKYADADGYRGGLDKLPQDIQDLLKQPILTGVDLGNVGSRLALVERWSAFADILGHADRDSVGGREFSTQLTHQVAKFVGVADLVRLAPIGPLEQVPPGLEGLSKGKLDGALQNLIGVSTRNHDANYDILTDISAYHTLQPLLAYNWTDDGQAATGLVKWIADDSAQFPAGTPQHDRATEAAAHLIETITQQPIEGSVVRGNGQAYVSNNFEEFFKGVKENPAFARAFGAIATEYLGDISAPTNEASEQDPIAKAFGGHLALTNHDTDRFFGLIATDRGAYQNFAAAAVIWEQRELTAAGGDQSRLEYLAERHGRLFGHIYAAAQNTDLALSQLGYEEKVNRYNDTKATIDYTTKAASAIVGSIPVVGSLASGLYDIVGTAIGDSLPEPSDPGYPKEQSALSPGVARSTATAAYVQNALDSGRLTDDQLNTYLHRINPDVDVEDFRGADGKLQFNQQDPTLRDAFAAAATQVPGASTYAESYSQHLNDSYTASYKPDKQDKGWLDPLAPGVARPK